MFFWLTYPKREKFAFVTSNWFMKYLIKILTIGIIPLLLVVLGLTKFIKFDLSSSDIIHVSEMRAEDSETSKLVKIDGKVTQIVPLVDSFAYQIEDKTGKIWVVTENQPPQMDQQIVVNGVLQYQKIDIGEQDFGDFYILESKNN